MQASRALTPRVCASRRAGHLEARHTPSSGDDASRTITTAQGGLHVAHEHRRRRRHIPVRAAPPRARSPALARYRHPRPPAVAAGLTSRQAAELQRIRARRGRITWRQEGDGRLLVAVHGDRPAASDAPLYLLMRGDGTIALAIGPPAPRPAGDER